MRLVKGPSAGPGSKKLVSMMIFKTQERKKVISDVVREDETLQPRWRGCE